MVHIRFIRNSKKETLNVTSNWQPGKRSNLITLIALNLRTVNSKAQQTNNPSLKNHCPKTEHTVVIN